MIIAALASIPSRIPLLGQCVQSLLPQVDHLRVYLNGYEEVPEFLGHPKIRVELSQERGDIGDAGKMWFVEGAPADSYYFTCDDDIVYPDDYVAKLVAAINADGKRSIWGVHGLVLHRKITRYYYSREFVFSYESALEKNRLVHLMGTGSTAWHTSAIKLSREDFPVPNMADIWLGVAARKQHVPMRAIARPEKWLKVLKCPRGTTIYEKCRENGDELQSWIVRDLSPWPVLE